jgi:hypothetical protein
MENWKNLEYKDHREFHNLSINGRTQGFDFERRSYDRLKLVELTKYDF